MVDEDAKPYEGDGEGSEDFADAGHGDELDFDAIMGLYERLEEGRDSSGAPP